MRLIRSLLFVASLLLTLLTGGACADEPTIYQVGISKVDITPDYPIRLNGFGNRRRESEGVSQRIYAGALAISSGQAKPLVLIAIDSLGVRIGEILAGAPAVGSRWPQALDLAAVMADDQHVPAGTRYDALRMIALAGWDRQGSQLVRYLAVGVSEELQMGAVSGLADIPSEHGVEPLIEALGRLSPRNRGLALEALVRTESRALALLAGIESARIAIEPGELKPLLEHESESVRTRAMRLVR